MNEGVRIGRNRVGRLMCRMGISAVAPKPATSTKLQSHKPFPYLLKDLRVTEPNLSWCADITYIPMRQGFMHLVEVMGWASRLVLPWPLPNNMETGFCLDTLDDALMGGASSGVLDTDQGAQSTRAAFTIN